MDRRSPSRRPRAVGFRSEGGKRRLSLGVLPRFLWFLLLVLVPNSWELQLQTTAAFIGGEKHGLVNKQICSSASGGTVPQPPQHLTVDGHVDMTGRWKCTDAGGEWDAVLAELGFGFFGRKALQAAGYGKDNLFRSFQHNGPHVRMIDHVHGLPDTVYEFEIGKQQLVNKALQISYWDVERPQILRWERAEETEGHPRKWITNCAFLLSTDQLRVETTSSTHKTAWWTFDRQAA
eukprot:Skav215306  [mRNA]  locus=scaffold2444:24639:26062:+ [translate_table: standard]